MFVSEFRREIPVGHPTIPNKTPYFFNIKKMLLATPILCTRTVKISDSLGGRIVPTLLVVKMALLHHELSMVELVGIP